jgi:hypothetical protein
LNPELWLLLSLYSQVLKEFLKHIFSTFPKTFWWFWVERLNTCVFF